MTTKLKLESLGDTLKLVGDYERFAERQYAKANMFDMNADPHGQVLDSAECNMWHYVHTAGNALEAVEGLRATASRLMAELNMGFML